MLFPGSPSQLRIMESRPVGAEHKEIARLLQAQMQALAARPEAPRFEPVRRVVVRPHGHALLDGERVGRARLSLPGPGCAWFRKAGGCPLRGFVPGDRTVPDMADFAREFDEAFDAADWAAHPVAYIENAGSTLHPAELPDGPLDHAVRRIAANPAIRLAIFETRAVHASDAPRFQGVQSRIGAHRTTVALPLSAQEDEVRLLGFGQGFLREKFAAQLRHIVAFCRPHVLASFGAPLATPAEALADALALAAGLSALAVRAVEFSPPLAAPGSLVDALTRAGLSAPPPAHAAYEFARALPEVLGMEQQAWFAPEFAELARDATPADAALWRALADITVRVGSIAPLPEPDPPPASPAAPPPSYLERCRAAYASP